MERREVQNGIERQRSLKYIHPNFIVYILYEHRNFTVKWDYDASFLQSALLLQSTRHSNPNKHVLFTRMGIWINLILKLFGR